jgi:hypothetical protein
MVSSDIRQYRKKLHDKVAALPFATVVSAEDDGGIGDDDSDDDPIDLRSFTAITATMGASTCTERDFSS